MTQIHRPLRSQNTQSQIPAGKVTSFGWFQVTLVTCMAQGIRNIQLNIPVCAMAERISVQQALQAAFGEDPENLQVTGALHMAGTVLVLL